MEHNNKKEEQDSSASRQQQQQRRQQPKQARNASTQQQQLTEATPMPTRKTPQRPAMSSDGGISRALSFTQMERDIPQQSHQVTTVKPPPVEVIDMFSSDDDEEHEKSTKQTMVLSKLAADIKVDHKNRTNDGAGPSTSTSTSTAASASASAQEDDHADDLPTNITDLNDDCLIKIFELLDLESLFNVALANKWLCPAAVDVYKRRFGTKEVIIALYKEFRPNTRQKQNGHTNSEAPIDEWYSFIEISSLKTALQYLRCFGGSIENLTIVYRNLYDQRYDYLHHYINQYCAGNLKCLTFNEIPKMEIKEFTKPFENVEKILVIRSDLGNQLLSFAQWFPNLQHLNLDEVRIKYQSATASFPNLNELTISSLGCRRYTPQQVTTALLNRNRHINKLHYDMYRNVIDLSLLLKLIEMNRVITTLIAHSFGIIDATLEQVQQLINEHPTLVELGLRCYRFSTANATVLLNGLNSLQTISFEIHQSEFTNLMAAIGDGWICESNNWYGNVVLVKRR